VAEKSLYVLKITDSTCFLNAIKAALEKVDLKYYSYACNGNTGTNRSNKEATKHLNLCNSILENERKIAAEIKKEMILEHCPKDKMLLCWIEE
jgi:hypothetical protein